MDHSPYLELASTILHDQGDDDTPPMVHSPEYDEVLGERTPTLETDGVLQRDKQKPTAYYDYASERSLSHVDSKLFYHRHQMDKLSSLDNLLAEESCVQDPTPIGDEEDEHEHQDGQQSGARLPGGFSAFDHPLHTTDSKQKEDRSEGNHGRSQPLYEEPHGYDHPNLRSDLHANGQHRTGGPSPIPAKRAYSLGTVHGGVEASAPSSQTPGLEITSELSEIYTNVQKILDKRHKYIRLSLQESGANPKDDPNWSIYPPPPEPAWNDDYVTGNLLSESGSAHLSRVQTDAGEFGTASTLSARKRRRAGHDIGADFDFDDMLPLPEESEMVFKLDEGGVYQVYENTKSAEVSSPILAIPTIRDFYLDLDEILKISSDGPTKSFAFRRLQYLEGKFNLYFLLNEYQEIADSKRVPHRDFYNVRKVDTHVHHSSCMNQKHLLRFIKSKMKKSPDEVVLFRDGKYLTLREVFESINLTAYDLSIDTLDMHVSSGRG